MIQLSAFGTLFWHFKFLGVFSSAILFPVGKTPSFGVVDVQGIYYFPVCLCVAELITIISLITGSHPILASDCNPF